MDLVIDIKENGAVRSLHSDGFDLRFLGRARVKRATSILFDEDKQAWVVLAVNGLEAYTVDAIFDSYEGARDFEIKWVNACLMGDVEPGSKNGLNIAQGIDL